MCIGDFGERGKQGGIDDVLVDEVGDDTKSGYEGYGKHVEKDITYKPVDLLSNSLNTLWLYCNTHPEFFCAREG